MRSPRIFLIFFLIGLLGFSVLADNWPQWRGKDANGISNEKGLPTSWSAEENIAWKVSLPGRGTSTPIVWGDQVFLTSQIGEGPIEVRAASDAKINRPDGGKVRFVVQCFHSVDGRVLWQYRLDAGEDLTPVHPKHNLATPSCVTDGKFVYCWFGTGQLVCLDLKGKVIWERHIGKEYSPFKLLWAHGSSPVLHRDSLL